MTAVTEAPSVADGHSSERVADARGRVGVCWRAADYLPWRPSLEQRNQIDGEPDEEVGKGEATDE